MSIGAEVSWPTVSVLIFSSWFSARRYSVYSGCARESRGPTRPLGSGEGSAPGRSDLSRSHRTAGHDEPTTLIPGSERTESLDTQIHLSDDVRGCDDREVAAWTGHDSVQPRGPLRSDVAPPHAHRRTRSVPSVRSFRRNRRDETDGGRAASPPWRGGRRLCPRWLRAPRGRPSDAHGAFPGDRAR